VKKAVIIPVYLRIREPEDILRSEGMRITQRAIKSLNILKDQDFTLILPVYFDVTSGQQEHDLSDMERMFTEGISDFRQREIYVVSPVQLRTLRDVLERQGFTEFYPLVDLKGYSKIRNTGLLIAQALSMDVVVFIDNDEVMDDPDYLRIACEFLNEPLNGKRLLGKGGFYLNPDGTIFLPSERLWWRFLWNKMKWMNCVWTNLLSSKERLVFSPMLLGGNLVLHRDLFSRVPFDPYIPRGEDTDYLINANQLDFCLLFDKRLRIRHLHPERTETFFHQELRGDIERFLYERKKMKFSPSISLDPYPGQFLKWTLYPRALFTSLLLGTDYLVHGAWTKAMDSFRIINLLFETRNKGWLNYLRFKHDWEGAMGFLGQAKMNP